MAANKLASWQGWVRWLEDRGAEVSCGIAAWRICRSRRVSEGVCPCQVAGHGVVRPWLRSRQPAALLQGH